MVSSSWTDPVHPVINKLTSEMHIKCLFDLCVCVCLCERERDVSGVRLCPCSSIVDVA